VACPNFIEFFLFLIENRGAAAYSEKKVRQGDEACRFMLMIPKEFIMVGESGRI